MARPVTLFTGQWADLPFDTMLQKAADFGYDGLELACWGDHFEVEKAVESDDYCKDRWKKLFDHGLTAFCVSNHLCGQAVCDLIDERHKDILPEDVWGDGDPEGVRQRAAQKLTTTGKAARRFMDNKPDNGEQWGRSPAVVNGFTGSSVWHAVYPFPPTSQEYIERGFQDFAKRWKPILDAFDKVDVNFGLEAHPSEIAFDIASAERAVKALDQHKRFGFNYDPSHLGYQGVDYVKFIRRFADRIHHVHIKDAWWNRGDGTVGVFGGHTDFADPRRVWDFRSVGRGDTDFEQIIVALNDIEYRGPLSIEWEDSRMDREQGATEACAFTKNIDFEKSNVAFDAQFDQ
jgi:sugar phosphate isomerase/epimerase